MITPLISSAAGGCHEIVADVGDPETALKLSGEAVGAKIKKNWL